MINDLKELKAALEKHIGTISVDTTQHHDIKTGEPSIFTTVRKFSRIALAKCTKNDDIMSMYGDFISKGEEYLILYWVSQSVEIYSDPQKDEVFNDEDSLIVSLKGFRQEIESLAESRNKTEEELEEGVVEFAVCTTGKKCSLEEAATTIGKTLLHVGVEFHKRPELPDELRKLMQP